MQKNFYYTVETRKPFDLAVQAVEQKTAEKGFRVLHTHDVAATLAEKGFPRDPLKIIEICNARYASEVLKKDVNIALMLPCPVAVYTQAEKTFISTICRPLWWSSIRKPVLTRSPRKWNRWCWRSLTRRNDASELIWTI